MIDWGSSWGFSVGVGYCIICCHFIFTVIGAYSEEFVVDDSVFFFWLASIVAPATTTIHLPLFPGHRFSSIALSELDRLDSFCQGILVLTCMSVSFLS